MDNHTPRALPPSGRIKQLEADNAALRAFIGQLAAAADVTFPGQGQGTLAWREYDVIVRTRLLEIRNAAHSVSVCGNSVIEAYTAALTAAAAVPLPYEPADPFTKALSVPNADETGLEGK